jgi:hypothetical protein
MRIVLARWLAGLVAVMCGIIIAAPASAACMQGHVQPVESVAPADREKTYDALVADQQVKAFEAHGFSLSACPPELQTAKGQAAERDRVCKMTYSGNESVQLQVKRALGIHPALLCKSAELVAGPWSGEKIDLTPDDFDIDDPPPA